MRIKIVAIGKIKEAYLKEGINEYVERIKPYSSIEILEVLDEPIKQNPSDAEIEIAKTKECSRALKAIKQNEYVISLDLGKKELNSVEFADFLEKKFVIGGSNITFLIGGSYGLSKEAKERVDDSISLSKMTFLHQMTRLILLEQIYRAFKINRNETYHK